MAARLRELPAAKLEAVLRLTGQAGFGAPIRVILVAEGTPAAREAPPWIAGYTTGAGGVVVLFPARAPTYPDSSLEDVLRHEIAHVLAARATAGHPLPRWFDEGLAMIAGNSWGLDDRSRVMLALLVDGELSLAELDRRFGAGERQVASAYAIAGAMVREMVQRSGAAAPGRILAGVAAGLPFASAFAQATGTPLAAFEADFWSGHSLRRWLPLMTSSATLWLGITLLALAAARRRRLRAAALRERWEEEERDVEQDGPGHEPS